MDSAGRIPALRFTIFGFPARIEASFVALVALLGFGLSAARLVLWVAVAAMAVLSHELGHALAARAVGASATISLEGLGGLTRPARDQPFSRREDALVTAAGPAAGLLIGVAAFAASAVLGWGYDTTGGFVLALVVFTTAGWSILNLLPVLPLDGGHLLVDALPGTVVERRLRAAHVSVAVAAAGGLLAYRTGSAYSALFAVLLVGYNLSSIKQLRGHQRTGRLAELYAAGRYDDVVDTAGAIAADTTAPNADRCIAARYEAVGLVLTNRYEEARAVLRRFDELDLGAGFAGYILAATGDPTGLVVARDAARAAPSPESIKWYAQALMISGQGSEAARVVEAHADLVERAEAEELTGIAFHAGEFTAAGRIADAARRTDPAYATLAYNGACSWSRAGAQRAAYASLEAAVRLGWSDFDQIDTDADLTGLRDTPEWVGQRARLAAVRPSTAGADPRRV